MPTLIIDGKEITVQPGTTIMEAARKLGQYIPHFCYHPGLSVAGNCRMCLVEVEKMPKPVASCAMPVNDGMVVKTASEMVRQARRGMMEFLLINHPLDCPVCDQGGDCSLQDLAMKYGPDRSRFHEEKRQVRNKNLGPLIETEMDRCIHCTRCIRFTIEVAGVEELGAMFRGDHMEVGPWVEQALTSEMAGNLAEICPVGALNDKPFHFQARSWELRTSPGVCHHCPVGCRVRRDHLAGRVKRIRADQCEPINQTWICDKGRFSYDGLSEKRLERPLVRAVGAREALPVAWAEALQRAGEILKGVDPDAVAGLADARHATAEALFAFQDLLRNAVGTPHIDHRLRQRDFSGDAEALTRADLLMNTSLEKLPEADCILLLGADPRFETPLLNLRLRRALEAGARVVAVNPRQLANNLPGLREWVVAPGEEPAFLGAVLAALGGRPDSRPSGQLAELLQGAKKPAILLGEYAVDHPQAESLRRLAVAILEACGALGGDGWNGYNRVAPEANAAAAQDLGVVPHRGPGYRPLAKGGRNAAGILAAAAAGEVKVLFLLGADPLLDGIEAGLAREALTKAQVIYLGTHVGPVVNHAAVVLPGACGAEQEATFTNAEGRVQRGGMAVPPPGEAKADWRILRALSDHFPQSLAYNTIEALREAMAEADHRYNLVSLAPGELSPACDHKPVTTGLAPAGGGAAVAPGTGLALVLETAFHHDDAVVRNSRIMAQLSPGNRVRINPADAAAHKVADGQRVRLIQGDRRVELTLAVDARVPQGVLVGHYGYAVAPTQGLGGGGEDFPRVIVAGL
ncbi:MAG: NADH-quinone oxidoreductase subunit NuoG [Magnetococcales bacterium]|nr:NADH-quinone oxidoreductase subunit NuoG [Magnetococcales bacterium]